MTTKTNIEPLVIEIVPTKVNKPPPSHLKIAFALASFWVSSILVVFINKFVLTTSSLNFSLLFIQNAVAAVFCYWWILNITGNRQPFDPIKQSPQIIKHYVLMTFTFVVSLALNNICLKIVTVSFFQVIRSLNIISVAAFSFFIFQQRLSPRSLLCLVLIVIGFLLTSDQESGLGTLDWSGVAFGLLASVTMGYYYAQIKKGLDQINNYDHAAILMSLYTNMISLPFLVAFSFISGEYMQVVQAVYEEGASFWLTTVISGALTFIVAAAGLTFIEMTSPISHNVSVQSKSVLQTVAAVWHYNEFKTSLWWIGNTLVVFGAALYTLVKANESISSAQLLPSDWEEENDNTDNKVSSPVICEKALSNDT